MKLMFTVKCLFWITGLCLVLAACKNKTSGKKFEVSGKIINCPGTMLYLEEVPLATMQRIIVDSVAIAKDGSYKLKAGEQEAMVYNLSLDHQTIAQVINDVPSVKLDVKFNNPQAKFPESYDIKGSATSQQLKEFMVAFNGKMQEVYENDIKTDSLKQSGVSDSVVLSLQQQRVNLAVEAKNLLNNVLKESSNPALSMMVLGYYQSYANNPMFKLEPVSLTEISKIVNDMAALFPSHQGLSSIKQGLDAEIKKMGGWVGQTAPEISLPDIKGKEVKLSSFKGKYVLVDFWASWCKPCRAENPNIVKAYNKFKGMNFTILGVSLDSEKGEWLKAIQKDNLTWTHISDLLQWNSIVVKEYAIDGIPFNVLIDPNGKIIAQGLHGQDLESKLAEVLQ